MSAAVCRSRDAPPSLQPTSSKKTGPAPIATAPVKRAKASHNPDNKRSLLEGCPATQNQLAILRCLFGSDWTDKTIHKRTTEHLARLETARDRLVRPIHVHHARDLLRISDGRWTVRLTRSEGRRQQSYALCETAEGYRLERSDCGTSPSNAAVFSNCEEALIEKAKAVQRSILNDAWFPVQFWDRSFDDDVRFQLISGPFKLDPIDLAVIEQEANTAREATSSGDPVPRQVGVHFDQMKSVESFERSFKSNARRDHAKGDDTNLIVKDNPGCIGGTPALVVKEAASLFVHALLDDAGTATHVLDMGDHKCHVSTPLPPSPPRGLPPPV